MAEEPSKVLARTGDVATVLSLTGAMHKDRKNGLGTKQLTGTWAKTPRDPCALQVLSRATTVTAQKASLHRLSIAACP